MKQVIVHYRPTCAFSLGAISFLALRGADFAVRNLDEDHALDQVLRGRLGDTKLETPTFEVDGELLVAPKLNQVKELLVSWGLPGDAAPHKELKQRRAEQDATQANQATGG